MAMAHSVDIESLFGALAPRGEDFEHRKMFGWTVCMVNGNLFIGLQTRGMMFRLPLSEQLVFLEQEGATPFEPKPGMRMKEYVCLADPLDQDFALLAHWTTRALAHASSLPRKIKKAAKPRAKPRKVK